MLRQVQELLVREVQMEENLQQRNFIRRKMLDQEDLIEDFRPKELLAPPIPPEN